MTERSRKAWGARLVLGVSVVTAACAGGAARVSTAACVPVAGSLQAGATLSDMPGRYRLTMVRTDVEGPRTEGELSLETRPSAMRMIGDVSTPLQGVVDIALGTVGAQRAGALDSDDPAAPGVLVMETDGARPGVMLRFGSTANRMDRVAFDEAFTALTVLQIDGGGFAGSWRSAMRALSAEGYFCATPSGS